MALSAAATYYAKWRPAGADIVEVSFPVAASTTIYKGAYLKLSSGYLSPWTGTGQRIGIATQTVDNSAGLAGAVNCTVATGRTRWESMAIAGTITAGSNGTEIYCASDDLGALTVTAGSNEAIGVISGNINATAQTANVDLLGFWGAMGGDFDGNVKINGTLNVTSTTTLGGAVQVNSTITVGVDDTGYDVKLFGATSGAYALWDESADSLLLVGGAKLNVQGTVTVGVDDTGYDVQLFGATAGAHLLWDESADSLLLVGGAKLNVQGTVTVGVDDTGYDVQLFGATAGAHLLWDESADSLLLVGGAKLNVQGTVTVGVDDTGYDVKLFGATASAYMLWDESADALVFAGGARIQPVYTLTVDADGATLTTAQLNRIYTTRGAAGAVTFTLPAAATCKAGDWVEFYNVANQNLVIAGQDEELVVFNDLTADSISYETGGELIGGGFRCVCDATSWIVVPLATETQTVTITSA